MQWESRAGPCYSGEAICAVTRVKVFKTYAEQVGSVG